MARAATKKVLDMNALFHVRFEHSPKPINCTTLPPTEAIVQDSRHPMHIPLVRRIEAWNPKRLHWAIRTPIAISKKRTIRSWVTRRVREAFIAELEKNGFNRRGEPVAGSKRGFPLTGALCITLRQTLLTAPIQDVNNACASLLKNTMTRKRP